MSPKPVVRIWIDPWRYLSVTANLTTKEAGELIERVVAEMESGDEEALRKHKFVSLENPYFAWKRLRRSQTHSEAAPDR